MDYNKPLDLLHMAEEANWVDKVNMARVDGRLCSWATQYHPLRLPCRLVGGFHNGSYNLGQKFAFDDGAIWFLRLPRASSISPEYADEKVAMEVEALHLVREKTSIPVPEVYAWGLASENQLELGPYILMEFIDGVCLNDVFGGTHSRLLKEETSDADIEYVYKQIAQFMLQLFKIGFDQIGSLPTPRTKYAVPSRPLTWKAHEILRVGGVHTFDGQEEGFSTAKEFFQFVNKQDWKQLRYQLNSIAGPRTARSRYASLKILESLIPDMTNALYDRGPFKLICDDFGPANMIVRSKEDLTIIGVVDLEWVYAGPAQLFGSAPWWLLLDRPLNDEWDFEGDEAPKATDRYFECLEIFKRVLEEEESKMGDEKKELSELVKWSEDSGAMWLHMLLSSGFFDSSSFPCMQLRRHKGADWWDERLIEYGSTEEVETFVTNKLHDLAAYDVIKDKVEHQKALLENKEMELETFIRTVSTLLDSN
ncbi:hypothetical protein N7519_003461 [Penicillium mononematosum]|uniref:uncharacterized protein n=1 Tax=Penicillium mononematosum TaxID=268346 RepID=UPI002548114E|nr:uncharacterized protein N7519_003461 [Penicillium mononematosum]KAJ6188553.1 hypothetical protein N7519_003461 [Penicillium mononematosum]